MKENISNELNTIKHSIAQILGAIVEIEKRLEEM